MVTLLFEDQICVSVSNLLSNIKPDCGGKESTNDKGKTFLQIFTQFKTP